MRKHELQYDPEARQAAIDHSLVQYEKYKHRCAKQDQIVVFNIDEPSYRKRLYVYDLNTKKITRNHHVCHGVKSSDPKDRAYAKCFSNENGSHKSSIGAMVTATTYRGKHGLSLKLQGLESKKNGNVKSRYIVIHPAYYCTNNYIMDRGRAGQSHGCPAIDPLISGALIAEIKGGTFFYIYHKQTRKQ